MEPNTHMYTPLFSAWCRTSPDGDTVLMLSVEGFEDVLEARIWLAEFVGPHLADELQETLH